MLLWILSLTCGLVVVITAGVMAYIVRTQRLTPRVRLGAADVQLLVPCAIKNASVVINERYQATFVSLPRGEHVFKLASFASESGEALGSIGAVQTVRVVGRCLGRTVDKKTSFLAPGPGPVTLEETRFR